MDGRTDWHGRTNGLAWTDFGVQSRQASADTLDQASKTTEKLSNDESVAMEAEIVNSVESEFKFHGDGENPALISILQTHLTLLDHPHPPIRTQALAAISSHLDLTQHSNSRDELLHALRIRLWKESEPFLIQSLIRVLVEIALLPHKHIPLLESRDGLVSSTTSPLKRKENTLAKSVSQLLQAYLGINPNVQVEVMHSLLKLGESLPWESLRHHLRSSNPKVRSLVLRLLVESVQEHAENAKRRRVDSKSGEILSSTLLSYMKDPFPSVRETAVRELVKLHLKGFEITSDCCKMATCLFRDSFESVRIAAIEMVGLWMRSSEDGKDGSSSKQRTEAFLQVCTTVTDMNMRVREAAFRVLGEATKIPENVLLQTLTKKVAKTSKEAEKEGDTDSPKFEENANLLDASAAGAFVHGLEDEYLEVRCVAIQALANLACMCEKMVFGAVSLLLDMLNEEVEVVRMQAMHALSQLATAGYLTVHDQHLHMYLSVVEDTSPEMRKGGRNLLASSRLSSFSTFHSIVRSLLSSLEQHSEDEKGVVSTFSLLGQVHPTYTECIVQELLQEMQGYLNEEVGLDEPRVAAILSLFLGAGLSNSNIISLIPARFLSYAGFLSHKLPESLPLITLRPVGLKSLQFSWSSADKLRSSSGHVRPRCRALHSLSPLVKRESG